MPLPNNFNMSIRLLDDKNSNLEIITKGNNSSVNVIHASNESKIYFYNVRSEPPISGFVPILLKSPEILVNGNVYFDKSNFYGQEINEYVPLNISGQVKAKFDMIDDFKEPFRNGIKVQYLSYLRSLYYDGKTNQLKQEFELPGDIPSDIKERGFDVPLISILSTPSNFIIVAGITIATIAVIWLLRKMKIYQ
jgi:hypothetical protein